MSKRPLWRISISTTPEAEEAVTELLETTFGQPACSYTDVETRETTVTVYLSEPKGGTPNRIPRHARSLRGSLEPGLERIGQSGLDPGRGKASLAKVRREDWAESWKRHFKPISIGKALLLRPSWSRRHPQKGQALVVLDPGLSFGTGQHPTTAFCLRQLAAQRRKGATASFLDIGTGSGILAIAAAKLGYAPIEAFDFDPEAVRIARANARRNRVAGRIHFLEQDVTRLPRRCSEKYAVVCANLIANLLLSERDRLLARLQPGGVLVLAGILKTEFPKIQAAYEAAGLRLVASRTENEWRSGAFRIRRAAAQ